MACILLTFLDWLSRSPVVAADTAAKMNAVLEQKDAKAFWLDGPGLVAEGSWCIHPVGD